ALATHSHQQPTGAYHAGNLTPTLVIDAFTDGISTLMLVTARLRHIACIKWGTRRYLCTEALNKMDIDKKSIA
ncbi:MAG: hypothetical protein KJO91_08355, partial [Gammaproteobacteria bacterium]|nr:hypothetical protein [Gammaproteobacteria bacterium]